MPSRVMLLKMPICWIIALARLECLIGYLYLKEDYRRLDEILRSYYKLWRKENRRCGNTNYRNGA